jgi:hypothetical protein
MSIVFYISGHGFGHASRDVEVINALAVSDEQPVVIRSSVKPSLLARTLRVPWTLLDGPCDTGIIQATSISHDDEATVAAALEFYATFDARVEEEVKRLSGFDVDLVVGDIPPLAFATAHALGVRSVALGNFTWDWIYETHPDFLPDGARVLEQIRDAYRHVDLALELPFSGGFEVFPRVVQVPLVARRATHPAGATRAHFGLPADRRLILLSFGGYGLPTLDLTGIDCAADFTIVTTDSVTDQSAVPSYVRVLPESLFADSPYRYEDLVAAVDVVMTKPGYGIIAECISTGTPIVYTSRGTFREYDVLVDAMPRYLRTAFLSQTDLFAGRWQHAIERALTQSEPPESLSTTGSQTVAGHITSMLTP